MMAMTIDMCDARCLKYKVGLESGRDTVVVEMAFREVWLGHVVPLAIQRASG